MYKNAIIIGPGFEQRVAKMAYSLVSKGIPTIVIAEDAVVAKEFANYIQGVKYYEIPKTIKYLNRLPVGERRYRYISDIVKNNANQDTLVIARDITYGAIVGKIIESLRLKSTLILDIADNFDLFYDACNNKIIRYALKNIYRFVQKRALYYSNAIIVVAPNNEMRLRKEYNDLVRDKKIILLRNVPLDKPKIIEKEKRQNTMVYVGRVDEISRDIFTPLYALRNLEYWSLHLYSNAKKETIEKLKMVAKEINVEDRLVVHSRVPNDKLCREISQYCIGLVPHKRTLLTDYTVPNKIYDYRNAGIITVMSDNPSLIEENKIFSFGVVYEQNEFIKAVLDASKMKLDKKNRVPNWEEEFNAFLSKVV